MDKFKKIISLFLSLCFVVSCAVIPVSVHASGVASVNGVEYATLGEAFDAASAGDTVNLIADVVIDSQLNVTKNVILSGDGSYSVFRSSDLSAPAITVEAGATLTLSSITLNGLGESSLTPFISVDGGTLNAREGVSFTGCYSSSQGGAIRLNAGICDLSGASFSDNSAMAGSSVYVSSNASAIRISGSTSFGSGDNIYLSSGKYIEITGQLSGSGSIFVQSANQEEGTRIALIADASIQLSEDQVKRFVVESEDGEKPTVLSGDSIVIGTATVSESVARIGEKEFETLEEAFASVSSGDKVTIELLRDVELKREIVVKSADITLIAVGSHAVSRASSLKVGYMFNVASGASLTIGGSGDPVTVSGSSVSATMPAIYCGGNVVLSSGSTVKDSKNVNPNLFYQGTVFVPEGGSLTIDGATVSSNSNKSGAVMVYGGTVTMNSGSVTSNTAENGGGVYIKSGTFNMKGGSISGNTASVNGGAIYCAGVLKLGGNASVPGGADSKNDIFLTGGRSISVEAGWNPGTAVAALTPTDTVEGTKLVYFASATEAKAEYFTFTGELAKKAKPRAKENYVFVGPLSDEAYVAYIGPQAYTSLVEAINAVPADSNAVTVTIVSDVSLNGTIVIPENKNIIFTTGVDPVSNASPEYTARTFKREGSFDGAFFSVAANARLQISPAQGKQIVFDGAGAPASNSVFVVLGTLEFQEGTIVRGNSNKKNEALTAAVPVFPVGGAVTVGASGIFNMNGGTLEANYASKGGAVFVSDGVFNMNGGTITKNSALFGGAVMIFNATTTDNVTEKTTAPTQPNAPATVPEKHGYMTMIGGTISDNSASKNTNLAYPNGQGGAIYIGNAATFEALGGTVSGNKAEAGAGIYVGTVREKGEKPLRVPVFLLSGAFQIAADNDVHLALVNESIITVTGALTGITSSKPMTVTLPTLLAQNTALVRFKIASNNDEQNRIAAGTAVNAGMFKLAGETDQFYDVAQSSLEPNVLLNVIPREQYLTYLEGRHYNGVPAYEEVIVEGQEQPVKNKIIYEPIIVNADGCFTSSFEMSYYVNLYTNLHTQLVAALPVGTKITLVDTSNPEKPSYYYYEVSGKETVRKPEVELNLTAEDDKPLDVYEIPLEDFLVMGENKLNFGEVEEEKPSTEKAAVKTERFTFIIDFENAEIEEKTIFEGAYTLAWEHIYPGETEGSYHNISKNFAVVKYTVADENKSEVVVEPASNGLKVSYKIDKTGRIASVGRGLVLIESVNDPFPAGTVVIANNTVYPVSADSGKIAVSIPLAKSGELINEGSFEIEFLNYYGSAILETPVRAVLYPSYDGLHITTGSNPDAESEGVNFALEALDSYAIAVTGADGKKPAYEFESAAKAETLLMTVNALCNAEPADKVTLTLQNAKNDYDEIPLSTLFVGYDDVDSEGIDIVVGACSMKLKESAPNGEYRMAFTVGDKTEYIKISIGK